MQPEVESVTGAVRLDGQVAVVTGAGGGLGRSHALALAAAGAKVLVNDLGGATDGTGSSTSAADAVVAEIREQGGVALADHHSVADAASAQALVAAAVDTWGRIDIVVNNAGVLRDRTLPKLSVEDIEIVLGVHLFGSYYVSQAAYVHMKEAGYGRFVHTTSGAGLFGVFGQSNYSTAKGGIQSLSRSIAVEGAKYGVVSNCIAPLAQTRLAMGAFDSFEGLFDPSKVSPLVVYLASPQAAVTGEVFSAGAGRYARAFVAMTPGWSAGLGEVVTAEDVRDHLDQIMDPTGHFVPASSTEEVLRLPEFLGIDLTAQATTQS
jgi:NAD(P)-dependent dehydrogenase (short-subunit alcohol dehydrogenase family)